MDLENAQARDARIKLDERKPPVSAAPAIIPPTTVKFTQAMQLREKKAEEERKREEELKKEEQKRKERQKEVKHNNNK